MAPDHLDDLRTQPGMLYSQTFTERQLNGSANEKALAEL